jgi:hypothetical protein
MRSNPLALGGLGITRYAGLAGEQACLLSRQVTYEFIEEFYPLLARGTVEEFWEPIILGKLEEEFMEKLLTTPIIEGRVMLSGAMVLASGEQSLDLVSALDETLTYEERRRARKAKVSGLGLVVDAFAGGVRSQAKTIRRRRHEDFLNTLDKGRKECAKAVALRSQSFKGSGKWLDGPGGLFYGQFAFQTILEYVAAFRQRLLLSPASKHVVGAESAVTCKCGKHIDLNEDPFHALDCKSSSQWYFIERHNAVRDALVSLLKDFHHEGNGGSVMVEPVIVRTGLLGVPPVPQQPAVRLGQTRSVEEWRRIRQARKDRNEVYADIAIDSHLGRQYIDIVVVNAAAKSYRVTDGGTPEWQNSEELSTVKKSREDKKKSDMPGLSIAVKHRVTCKKHNYRPVLGEGVDTDQFIPFVVEASGQFSKQANSYLDNLFNGDIEGRKGVPKKSVFKAKIDAVIARYNARAALSWARGVVPAQP